LLNDVGLPVQRGLGGFVGGGRRLGFQGVGLNFGGLVGLAFALLRYVLRSGGPRNLGAQGEANVRVAASSSYRSW